MKRKPEMAFEEQCRIAADRERLVKEFVDARDEYEAAMRASTRAATKFAGARIAAIAAGAVVTGVKGRKVPTWTAAADPNEMPF